MRGRYSPANIRARQVRATQPKEPPTRPDVAIASSDSDVRFDAAGKPSPIPWEPLVECEGEQSRLSRDAAITLAWNSGKSISQVYGEITRQRESLQHFRNSMYAVTLGAASLDGWNHITVRHHDGRRDVPWQHRQAIKNELAGPEHEAVELLPAESRLVDIGNVYHIWVQVSAGDCLEIGFHKGRTVMSDRFIDEAKWKAAELLAMPSANEPGV